MENYFNAHGNAEYSKYGIGILGNFSHMCYIMLLSIIVKYDPINIYPMFSGSNQ